MATVAVSAATVRGWQLDQLRKNLAILPNHLRGVSAHDATAYRDGGTGWTALQVLCHLRDYEAIFLERATLTVEQESPPLPNPDPDALAAERRYNEQDFAATVQEWLNRREAFLAYLTGLDEAAWARTAQHPRRGTISLQDQLALVAFHDVNHLEQIVRVLGEQRVGG